MSDLPSNMQRYFRTQLIALTLVLFIICLYIQLSLYVTARARYMPLPPSGQEVHMEIRTFTSGRATAPAITPGVHPPKENVPLLKPRVLKYHTFPPDHEPHNITVRTPGRLGNLLFAFASLFGIARINHMTPVLTEDNPLLDYFTIAVDLIPTDEAMTRWPKFVEEKPNTYDGTTEMLNYDINIELVGYFQSWKYFSDVKKELRKHLQFKPIIQSEAEIQIKSLIHKHFPNYNASSTDTPTLVGIHVRRGDMTEFSNIEMGYTVAEKDYIDVAISYFEGIYRKVLFVVTTDDPIWSLQNVRRQRSPIVFSEGNSDIIDLAILSLCNHTIITVGTFGWWAAWLAGGTTLYYSDFPEKYSLLGSVFEPRDYYCPGWIGLSAT